MTSGDKTLLPIRLAGGMLTAVGVALLGAMLWISTWPREAAGADAAFVTPLLPGHRFLPEILPRLGEIGGGAAGLGLALLLIAALLGRRRARAGM